MGVIFANIIAIYRRELQSYFLSPLAYAIAGIFWFLAGLFFVNTLEQILAYVASLDVGGQQLGIQTPALDVPYEFIRGFLDSMGTLLLFILPVLSMGLYAEERKRGTLELLATSPITNWTVAVGKLLGVLTFVITLFLPLLVFEVMVLSTSNPPIPLTIVWVGHLGLILLAGSILALGMFISSLTDSTILAAVMTFALVLSLLFINFIAERIGGTIGSSIGHFSLLKHYSNLVNGIFDTSSVILFLSYIFLGVFLTAQSIDAFRFQRQ